MSESKKADAPLGFTAHPPKNQRPQTPVIHDRCKSSGCIRNRRTIGRRLMAAIQLPFAALRLRVAAGCIVFAASEIQVAARCAIGATGFRLAARQLQFAALLRRATTVGPCFGVGHGACGCRRCSGCRCSGRAAIGLNRAAVSLRRTTVRYGLLRLERCADQS